MKLYNFSNKIQHKKNLSWYLYITLKRIFDILVSLVGVVFLMPILVVVKICYLLHKDYHPIIYSQIRIGKNGKHFRMYKLRSMVNNAEKILEQLIQDDKEIALEYKINKKLRNDPRVTKIGKILRDTSLDETPQFINILLNDMSLIGNRPYLPAEKEDMQDYFENITRTKCGLVSLWAINGRSNENFARRLALENYYSDHQSLTLDAQIFFKAFEVVLLRKGAK